MKIQACWYLAVYLLVSAKKVENQNLTKKKPKTFSSWIVMLKVFDCYLLWASFKTIQASAVQFNPAIWLHWDKVNKQTNKTFLTWQAEENSNWCGIIKNNLYGLAESWLMPSKTFRWLQAITLSLNLCSLFISAVKINNSILIEFHSLFWLFFISKVSLKTLMTPQQLESYLIQEIYSNSFIICFRIIKIQSLFERRRCIN